MSIDWSALLEAGGAPGVTVPETPWDTYGVTEKRSQTIDLIAIHAERNPVTTVTAETEEGPGSSAEHRKHVPVGAGCVQHSASSTCKQPDGALHELNPAAVVLCFHAMRAKHASDTELAEALHALTQHPPAEQQRQWAQACKRAGLTPWRLLTFAPISEDRDCMGCAHLVSHSGRLLLDERRAFRWGCAKGWPVREVARASERIICAPDECNDWTRFRPIGKGREPTQSVAPPGCGSSAVASTAGDASPVLELLTK